MTEVQDCKHVFVYYARCPICRKLYAGLSKYQLLQNVFQHGKKHNVNLTIDDLEIKYKTIDLCG